MATQSHKKAQAKAAGKGGKKEVPLRSGRRLDALSKAGKATEIERSDSQKRIDQAARRLKTAKKQGARSAELKVKHGNLDKGTKAMRKAGIKGTVSNITGSKKRRV